MATLASTNVTGSISPGGEKPLMFGDSGLCLQVFTVAGGAVGDTAALTPDPTMSAVYYVLATQSATSNTSTTGTTNVTLTLTASASTATTFQAFVYGRRP